DFVACVRLCVEEKHVQTASAWLPALDVLHIDLTEVEKSGILRDLLLQPLLRELWMSLQADSVRPGVFHDEILMMGADALRSLATAIVDVPGSTPCAELS